MRSRIELTIEVEHPEEYDVANEFVWYFCDDPDIDFTLSPYDVFVVSQDVEVVK